MFYACMLESGCMLISASVRQTANSCSQLVYTYLSIRPMCMYV